MLPTLIRRRGWKPFESPFDLMNETFNRVLAQSWDDADSRPVSYPVDVWEDENHFHIEAELPGFRKEDVSVTLENGTLTIQAERKPSDNADKPGRSEGQQHVTERRYTRVARSFTLPTAVDESKVEARLEDGVLHLKVAKAEQVKPRRITVQ